MKRFMTMSIWLGILSTTFLLSACGGSGGSGGGFQPPAINETPVAITTTNQNSVTTTATEGISGTTGSGSLVGVVASTGGPSFNVFDFSSTKLLGYVTRGNISGSNVVAGAVMSQTIPCDSGEIVISINMADTSSSVLNTNDSATLSARNCYSSIDGTTANGSFSFTVTAGSVDMNCDSSLSTCPDVTLSVSFNQFSVNDGGTTATIHGGFTMSNSDASGTASFSGTSLYLIAGSEALHLTNFNVSTTIVGSGTFGNTTSTTGNLTLAGTVIDGSISIAISDTDPILQDEFEAHPHAGTVVVTGAGGATLTIVYVDAYTVDLTLDPDGAGPTPANPTVSVLWTAM